MSKSRMTVVTIIVLAFLFVFVACAGTVPSAPPAPTQAAPSNTEATSAPQPTASNTGEVVTLNYNMAGGEPQGIDPGVAGDYGSAVLDNQLFQGLLALDYKTSEIKPELADKWEVSQDGLTWTFHMGADVPWVHYDPATGQVEKKRNVNAHDIEYAVKRVAKPETAANWAYLLYHQIKNLFEVNTGVKGVTVDDVGVKATDDKTVVFTLEHPVGFFPYIIAMQTTRPEPPEIVDQFGDKWTEPGNIWTNGPYVLTEWIHGNKITLQKNPFYKDADKIQIERIEITLNTDLATQLSQYETNKLDTIVGLPPDDIERIKNDPTLSKQLTIQPSLGVAKVEWVNTKPPFDDVRVRQAFSAAIDRQTLVDKVTKGGEIPATTYAPPGVFGAVPPEEHVGQGYDPELAKKKFQEFLNDKKMTVDQFNATYQLTYGTTCTDFSKRVQQAIAAMWKEILGVDTKLECQESKTYIQTIKKETPVEQTYHIHSAGWNVDYPDQSDYISWYRSDAENFARRGCADPNCKTFTNNEFDKIIAQADASSDPEERKKLYHRAEEIAFGEEFAWAPIYWRTNLILTKPWLKRDFPALGIPNFKDWTLDWNAKKAAQ